MELCMTVLLSVLGLAKDPGVDRSTPFNQLRVGTQRQH